MKHLFHILTAAIIPTLCMAQPTITDIEPSFGDMFTIKQNNTEMSPGASGANISWDYSTMGFEYSADYILSDPSTVDGNEFFPGSTIAWTGNIADLGDINGFFSFENGAMMDHGTYNFTSGFEITNVYSEPLTIFQTPLNYQNTFSTSYSTTTTLGTLISTDYDGTYDYEIDAYGTVTTPFGTFENALRVKVIQDQTSNAIVPTQDITTEYHWFVPDYPLAVLVISTTESFFMGQPESVDHSNSYLSDFSFATNLAKQEFPSLAIYPNPAQNQITIQSDFEGQAVLNIYTVDGKLMSQQNIQNNQKLNVSNLIPGFYIGHIKIDGETYSRASFTITK